jgi:hypothetical protein
MPKAAPDVDAIFAKVLLAGDAVPDTGTTHEPAAPDVLGTPC